MLNLLLIVLSGVAEPSALSRAPEIADTSMSEASIDYLINQCLKLQSEDTTEDLKLLAAQLKAMANQKQHLRDMMQEIVRAQDRPPALRPLRMQQQRDWAVALPRLCPPGPERADCIERHLKIRLDILRATGAPR